MATDNGWRRADGPARTDQGAPARGETAPAAGGRGRRARRRRRAKRFLLAADALLLCVLIFALAQLVRTLADYRRSAGRYEQIAEAVVSTAAPAAAQPAAAEQPARTAQPSEVPIQVDFAALKAVNPDAAAWLYCADTPVNYPAVLGPDNSYYLYRAFDGSDDSAGTLFFDCRNSPDLTDRHLVLYGHRMKDDSMFGSLVGYAEESYREAHPVMYLLTEAQNYRVEIFACRTVTADDLDNFTVHFPDESAYIRYLADAVSDSYWQPPFPIERGYATLTMVTCSTYRSDTNPRVLVHGRLVPVD